MVYIMDANVFIQAKNGYYAFDICPGFWVWLDRIVDDGHVVTIAKVYDELANQDDDLSIWIRERREAPWIEANDAPEIQAAFEQVTAYVHSMAVQDRAKAWFLGKADPWLIARAMVKGGTVVTHEKRDPDARKRVKIPDVADAFGVPCQDTFTILRLLEARFVLDGDGVAA